MVKNELAHCSIDYNRKNWKQFKYLEQLNDGVFVSTKVMQYSKTEES